MTPSGFALAIPSVCLTVPDLAVAERFYAEALGFTVVTRSARLDADGAAVLGATQARIASVRMRLGAQHLELIAFDPPGRPYPADSTSSDLWFQHCAIVVRDMAVAYSHLHRFDIMPISQGGPQVLPPNTGSVTAYKFRDPFGHPLELLRFPDGVGDANWHKASESNLFLGIDHTAIAVSDADRSIKFYADRLGFQLTGRSHNSGEEQSQLDAIPDDRVEVVALSPQRQPPHLELLAYQTGTRRAGAADWNAADLAVTRTFIEVNDLAQVRQNLDAIGSIDKDTESFGGPVFDPDGHPLILHEAK